VWLLQPHAICQLQVMDSAPAVICQMRIAQMQLRQWHLISPQTPAMSHCSQPAQSVPKESTRNNASAKRSGDQQQLPNLAVPKRTQVMMTLAI